ncbi:zinc finger with UFM1-specific peptidase domain protein isoform X4 [Cucumis melo var. makuwa]|uniref:Zinc finger with UFM1-specific peptidase domain protein isoform X4 n=1 Tax=Cucumis melo var. makuwa TaxID=1194695 RepID=A0A5D3BRL3_CUCMM|nr:zinc finger with UFM1-specific peptidase domain protein isoform X4 [Cucumis melo var. makuwa]
MNSSSCPFCDQVVPSDELQRHANGHFEDGDNDNKQRQLAMDFELAQQLAFSSTSYDNDDNNGDMPQEIKFEGSLSSNRLSCETGTLVMGELTVTEKISCLIGSQNRGAFWYVDHYQSIEFEDFGWGCGWRNIQMLCSHLLMQRPETRNILFGGSGVVPDIPSLQRWLEIAWERGFDVHGAEHFNYKIYGKKNWIGTTECAALLRSFGLQARIIDFGPKECEELYLSVPGSSSGAQMNTRGLERALRENIGWQQLMKRGIHTLNKPQYQLCYIDSGIAAGVDVELLKTIDSIFLEL